MREKLIELLKEAERRNIDEAIPMTMEQREKLLSDGDGYGFYADHLIANGVVISNSETTTKWIPVTERLPEHKDGHVLVTDGERVKISCRNACYKTASGEMRCAQGYGSGMAVTHWMPMPEPPKGE